MPGIRLCLAGGRMIRIDLSVPHRRQRPSILQFGLFFVGIFLGISVIVVVGLLLQWHLLGNLEAERDELAQKHDSLTLLKREMTDYEALKNRHRQLTLAIEESSEEAHARIGILNLLYSELEPGMKLLSCSIEPDSVVAYYLSPSNVKVARYVESLSKSGLIKVEKSEPQGTTQGLIEHRVLLRIP